MCTSFSFYFRLVEDIQEQSCSKQLPISETQEPNTRETQKPNTSESSKSTIRIMNKPIIKPRLSVSSAIAKSSNKKKKKDLLAQILTQEQESKTKKNNLSSFLISL